MIMGKKGVHSSNFIDIIGQQFGKLLVIRYSHTDKNRRSIWLCKCECGTEKNIPRGSLVQGDTKSCGCSHLDKIS